MFGLVNNLINPSIIQSALYSTISKCSWPLILVLWFCWPVSALAVLPQSYGMLEKPGVWADLSIAADGRVMSVVLIDMAVDHPFYSVLVADLKLL